VFGRRLSHVGHSHGPDHPHPLRRRVLLTLLAAAILAALALLIAPPHAHGNFVYWANDNETSIGRAKINGAGTNNNFITGVDGVHGVTIDSKFIYWTRLSNGTSSIGRANLDGSGVNNDFITADVTAPTSIAVTSSAIYWTNEVGMGGTSIGRANLDGSSPNPNFIAGPVTGCGLVADSNFLYFFGNATHIGRAGLDGNGVDRNFITIPDRFCGLAVDPSFLYWSRGTTGAIGRVAVGGGATQDSFVSTGTSGAGPCGVAVNSQYLFWGNQDANTIGRSNVGGGSPNPTLIAGPTNPCQLAAAPSNKITVNSVSKKKKKGTATINAKVPGPGQVTLNQTNTPPDVNATAAGVKQVGLTITQASSFGLAVKPVGKTAKKLSKQIKKQLRKKRKAKAKVGVTVFVHFIPAGVAAVSNTQQVKVTLVRQRTKKKR
jgi:virginiamycin B lyase